MGTTELRTLRGLVMTWYLRLLLALQYVGRQLRRPLPAQSMVEYAIVAALVAIVAMAAVQALGSGVAQVFQRILQQIQGIGG